MSTTEIPLNPDQAEAILIEMKRRGHYEWGGPGEIPQDPDVRLVDARHFVEQADLADRAGNRGDVVNTVLFIARVDQRPIKKEEKNMASTATDLAAHSDEMLLRFRKALENIPPDHERAEEAHREIVQIDAEIQRREAAKNGQAHQEDPSPAPQGAGQAAPAQQPVGGTSDNAGADQAQATPTADAEPPAGDQAAQPSQEGLASEAQSPSQDERRAALEEQLTFGIIRAHEVDPSQISTLSFETLEWMLANPQGPAPDTSLPDDEEPQPEQPVEAPSPPAPQQTIETPAPVSASGITPEREALEAQVTGSMLKAFGRGRRDVPTIGNHELRFMVEHPDAKVTREQLAAEQAKDQDPAQSQPSSAPAPQTVAEQILAEQSVQEEQLAPVQPTLVEDGFSPRAQPIELPQPTPAQAPALPPAPAQQSKPRMPADEIIEREHLPIAPEIEDPPQLPNDMSKLSDDDLRSLHARSHACHARVNWIITHFDDEISDLEKLKTGREVEIRNTAPKTVDGKRVTKDQMEAVVAGDSEIVRIDGELVELRKGLRKLSALRDNYSRDVAVCSRQWSMRYREAEGAGGLRRSP